MSRPQVTIIRHFRPSLVRGPICCLFHRACILFFLPSFRRFEPSTSRATGGRSLIIEEEIKYLVLSPTYVIIFYLCYYLLLMLLFLNDGSLFFRSEYLLNAFIPTIVYCHKTRSSSGKEYLSRRSVLGSSSML